MSVSRSENDEATRKKGKWSIYFDRLLDIFGVLSCVAICGTWISISSDVFLRYFANSPQIWVQEFIDYILLFVTFMGAAWLLRAEGHINIDLISGRLKPRNRAILTAVTSILSTMVCVIVVYFGIFATLDMFQGNVTTTSALQLPKGPFLALVPFGFTLLVIQFVRRTLKSLRECRAATGSETEMSEEKLELSL